MSNLVIIGEVNNPDWVKKYGKFQKVYRQEEGVNATDVATNMLKGIERKGTIEGIGNINCITGFSVGIQAGFTGMVGVFQIDSDTHIWENGVHTMTLNINYDQIMDMTTYRTKKQKGKKSSIGNAVIQWDL